MPTLSSRMFTGVGDVHMFFIYFGNVEMKEKGESKKAPELLYTWIELHLGFIREVCGGRRNHYRWKVLFSSKEGILGKVL